MKRDIKPILALTAAALLLSEGLCGTIQAQTVLKESGTTYLADIFSSSATSPETLSVSWFVLENTTSGIYTYGYNLFNPPGDVALNNNGTPTTTPEVVNTLNLSFSVPTTGFFQLTPPAGGTAINNGPDGVTFTFPDVSPGNYSPLLAIQSSTAPDPANASADGGAVPPGPWSTVPNIPNNVPIAVPQLVPEPATTTLLGLALFALPFRGGLRRFIRGRQ